MCDNKLCLSVQRFQLSVQADILCVNVFILKTLIDLLSDNLNCVEIVCQDGALIKNGQASKGSVTEGRIKEPTPCPYQILLLYGSSIHDSYLSGCSTFIFFSASTH